MTSPDSARPFPRPRISRLAYVFCGLVAVGAVFVFILLFTTIAEPHSAEDVTGTWERQGTGPEVVRLEIAADQAWKLAVETPAGTTRCYGKRVSGGADGIRLYLSPTSENEACGEGKRPNFLVVPSRDLRTMHIVVAGQDFTLVRSS